MSSLEQTQRQTAPTTRKDHDIPDTNAQSRATSEGKPSPTTAPTSPQSLHHPCFSNHPGRGEGGRHG